MDLFRRDCRERLGGRTESGSVPRYRLGRFDGNTLSIDFRTAGNLDTVNFHSLTTAMDLTSSSKTQETVSSG
jgi:hypothetical protein